MRYYLTLRNVSRKQTLVRQQMIILWNSAYFIISILMSLKACKLKISYSLKLVMLKSSSLSSVDHHWVTCAVRRTRCHSGAQMTRQEARGDLWWASARIFFCVANGHKHINNQLSPSSNVLVFRAVRAESLSVICLHVSLKGDCTEAGTTCCPTDRLAGSPSFLLPAQIKTKWEVIAPPRLCFVPATLGTSDNGSNEISSTGSQPSAAEHDCIRAVKAKVSWTVDGDWQTSMEWSSHAYERFT